MYTINRTTTTEMEVTSIRLERDLKDKLKELSGNQGYQALIRDVLWDFVEQKSGHANSKYAAIDVRATVEAIAQREEICALTGAVIKPREMMFLGFLADGEMIPLSRESWAS
jgi:metal-responsive CopG/Arc/MetJ family transcriptional regulator